MSTDEGRAEHRRDADEATVIDADDVDPGDRPLIDPPPERDRVFRTLMSSTAAQRRPIVPAWLRDRHDARSLGRFVVRHGAHVSAYHFTRSPKYAARLTVRAPVGALRAGMNVLAWWWDREGAPLRRTAVERGDLEGYMRLVKERNARVRGRGVVVAALVAVLLAACVVLALFAPGWALALAAGLAVAVLGALGTPADQRVFDTVTNATGGAVRLTSEIVTRALRSLGIAGITGAEKAGSGIGFPQPIARDGPGWRATVDLPHGVTVGDIVERRDRLASGLRRPLGCVWPEPANDVHAGRLILWVGDQDMNAVKAPAWPLAKAGTRADLFAAFPFGTDQRGRRVEITLMFGSLLIGAMPRFGKTFAMRLVMLAVALDVTAELRVFELKGTGDLSPVEPCCHRYGSGADDDTVGACLDTLREVHKDLERRSAVIRKLPKTVCPENKVTPDLARRRDLGLHPLVIGIDECQELFTHPDHGAEADRLATAIIKRGPAMGVMLVLATQRPDSKSLPTGVSANVGIRFCLRVMGQTENDMVLGTSSYKNGIRATTFTDRDKGIGYLVGASDSPQVVRGYYLDAPGAESIGLRARGLREAAGRLSGHAAGQAPEREDFSLLDDVRSVLVGVDGNQLWHSELLARLVELRPEVYSGWGVRRLGEELRAHGVRTVQVAALDEDGARANRRGCRLDDLDAAVTAGRAPGEIEP